VTWALIVQLEADLADETNNFILRCELCEPRRMIVTRWWFHAILRDAPKKALLRMKQVGGTTPSGVMMDVLDAFFVDQFFQFA